MALDLPTIRSAAAASRVKWRYHALLRAVERGITREQALRVILDGELLEQHPRARPYPKCLMMHLIEPDRPLYVALAYDKAHDYLHIITVHWLDPSKWEDPWTRRPRRRKTYPMKKTTNQKQELCAVCGGELRDTTITHEEHRGGHLYLFENVPAQVCTKCGEIWIDEKTLQAIDRLIAQGRPTRHVPTPLYDFALSGAR